MLRVRPVGNERNCAGLSQGLSSRLQRLIQLAFLASICLGVSVSASLALSDETIDLIEQVYKGKVFRLRSNFHQPSFGGKPAPYLDKKRWHYRDRTRPIVFYSGEEMEITGIYSYGSQSLFLEIARPASPEMLGFRQRVRFRVTVEATEEEPEEQLEQLKVLIRQALSPLAPLEWPEEDAGGEGNGGAPQP
jgi:hypothetical protein